MAARKLGKLRKDLAAFLDAVVGTLGNSRRRRWCETYVRGVLLDGQRKSIEPMAARLQAIEQSREDYEQALQQFINKARETIKRFSMVCKPGSVASLGPTVI
jgi:SRSO17 transposase